MARLAAKVALITGTGQGTGRAAALAFAREGAFVIGCDLKTTESEETVRKVRSIGGQMVSFHPVDIGDRTQAQQLVENAVKQQGKIDILFNNAAAPKFAPFESFTPADWAFTFRNEIDVIFHVTQAIWTHMIRQGGGSIINMASQSGLMGDPNVGQTAHATCKAGVIALSKQLAAEGALHGIRVNSISPGALETPAALWTDDIGAQVRASIPLKRAGKPEDIAPIAVYLASDESSFATGANFVIDGGKSNIWPHW